MSEAKTYRTLMFSENAPGVGLVRLNRPEQLNAIDVPMVDELTDLFASLSQNEAIHVVILTGEGRGFCSGADLREVVSPANQAAFADPESFLRLAQERYASLILGLRNLPQPVIAAVNGPAAGAGFALALASDVRIASPEAYFVASFINIGLSGGELGTSYFLPRLVGLSRASEILLTGRKVSAAEAEGMGLVNRVVPRETLLDEAVALACKMTGKSVGGLKLTKRVLERNIDAPSLAAAVDLENRNQAMLVFSGDFGRLIVPFAKTPRPDQREG